jgi:Zn-dependent protease
MSSDITIQLLLFRLIAGLMVVTVHGVALAMAAVWLGDDGPRHDGRLTLFPSAHVDMLGLGSIMLTGLGWGRPVAIEAGKLRTGRWGLAVAVLAASAAVLALAALLPMLAEPLLTTLPLSEGLAAAAFVRVGAQMCVWIALFALLPVPPLAGAHLLVALGIRLPRQAGTVFGLALIAASISGLSGRLLAPLHGLIAPILLGVDLAR